MNLGTRLKQIRKEHKISVITLSEYLGITRQSYYFYESDDRTPDLDVLDKLANFYGTTVDYIIGRTNCRDGIVFSDLPENFKGIGVKHLEISKQIIEKGLSLEQIEEIMKAIKTISENK